MMGENKILTALATVTLCVIASDAMAETAHRFIPNPPKVQAARTFIPDPPTVSTANTFLPDPPTVRDYVRVQEPNYVAPPAYIMPSYPVVSAAPTVQAPDKVQPYQIVDDNNRFYPDPVRAPDAVRFYP